MADLPPLHRILRLGSAGRDVRALQRALQAAGVRPEPPTPKPTTFDESTFEEVRAFQKQHLLFDDGEVGKDTYGALASFYDTRGVMLLNSVKDASPNTIRRRIAKAAHCGYVNRDEIHYTQEAGKRMEGSRGSVTHRTPPTRRIARRSRSGATGRPTPRIRTTRGTAAVGPDPCCSRARRSRSTRPPWEISRSTARAVRTSATRPSTSATGSA